MGQPLILVSACLVGLPTRYDGWRKQCPNGIDRIAGKTWIPVCPEQLGGLPTPRPPANLIGGNGADVLNGTARVVCIDGTDVTQQFIAGARLVLEIAQSQPAAACYLKARSPSCGISKLGVCAALLEQHGFTLIELD